MSVENRNSSFLSPLKLKFLFYSIFIFLKCTINNLCLYLFRNNYNSGCVSLVLKIYIYHTVHFLPLQMNYPIRFESSFLASFNPPLTVTISTSPFPSTSHSTTNLNLKFKLFSPPTLAPPCPHLSYFQFC